MCARHDRFHPARKGGSGPPADNKVTVGSLGACGWPQTAASILQYQVPALCPIGAGISAWKQRNRARLAQQAASNRSTSVVDGLSWQRFEHLVGESFRRQGFGVKETGNAGADGGVDLELRKGTELHLVQCKHWKALKVGVDVVRELYGAMAARGAASGYVVTSGSFTDATHEFANGRNVQLIDGSKLKVMLRGSQQPAAAQTATAARDAESTQRPAKPPAPPQHPPTCPKCGKGMVKRTATRGAKEGQAFWGCAGFPSCRGTRAV